MLELEGETKLATKKMLFERLTNDLFLLISETMYSVKRPA